MATDTTQIEISDEERAADGRADAYAAIVLVAVIVLTAIFWVSGQ